MIRSYEHSIFSLYDLISQLDAKDGANGMPNCPRRIVTEPEVDGCQILYAIDPRVRKALIEGNLHQMLKQGRIRLSSLPDQNVGKRAQKAVDLRRAIVYGHFWGDAAKGEPPTPRELQGILALVKLYHHSCKEYRSRGRVTASQQITASEALAARLETKKKNDSAQDVVNRAQGRRKYCDSARGHDHAIDWANAVRARIASMSQLVCGLYCNCCHHTDVSRKWILHMTASLPR